TVGHYSRATAAPYTSPFTLLACSHAENPKPAQEATTRLAIQAAANERANERSLSTAHGKLQQWQPRPPAMGVLGLEESGSWESKVASHNESLGLEWSLPRRCGDGSLQQSTALVPLPPQPEALSQIQCNLPKCQLSQQPLSWESKELPKGPWPWPAKYACGGHQGLQTVGDLVPKPQPQELRSHFEDSSQAQEAEAEIKSIRQKGRPVKELVLEFRRLATNLRPHYFQESLDEELLKICFCHGLPEDRIYEWYQMAIAM
ncbi:hypothetical protein L345_16529, partial [Ophiophagus hannah]